MILTQLQTLASRILSLDLKLGTDVCPNLGKYPIDNKHSKRAVVLEQSKIRAKLFYCDMLLVIKIIEHSLQ